MYSSVEVKKYNFAHPSNQTAVETFERSIIAAVDVNCNYLQGGQEGSFSKSDRAIWLARCLRDALHGKMT